MTDAMRHDEARDALEAFALDALDAPERAAVLAHLRGCAECRAELEVLERTASDLSYAVAPVAMSARQRDRVRARLLARAAADAGAGAARPDVIPISARVAPVPVRARRLRTLAIAASVVAIASLALLARATAERTALRESLRLVSADRGARAAAADSLRAAMAERDRMIANLTGPDVAVMRLASADPASPSAMMFWDRTHDAWVFVAHHLARPKPGRAYQLWLVTPTAKISAGMLMPGATGDAMLRATYALPKDSLAAVAVTEEPESGSPQPTSTPFLVATKGR